MTGQTVLKTTVKIQHVLSRVPFACTVRVEISDTNAVTMCIILISMGYI